MKKEKFNKIEIDKNTKIVIEPDNYVLKRRIKLELTPGGTKPVNEYAWKIDGYFGNLVSLAQDYINSAPRQGNRGSIQSLQDVIKAIKDAERKIAKSLKNLT